MKEQAKIQQKLWGSFVDKRPIDILDRRIGEAKAGHLPRGKTLKELSAAQSEILGNAFAPRVVIMSVPESTSALVSENIAIAGGWCALRTADVRKLGNGQIVNPITGQREKITSVEQVADWITDSIAFDQIVEAIGGAIGGEYLGISEQEFWSQRIIEKLNERIGKDMDKESGNKILDVKQQEKIREAIEKAEEKRAEMTQRYLRFVTGRNVRLRRIVDADIMAELKQAQNELFKKAGLSVEELSEMFPKQRNQILSRAVIWSMYSEPYFDILRRTGNLSKVTVYIVEPILHAAADDDPGKIVVEKIYQNKGIYFDKDGINANTGFVAYMECIDGNGNSTRRALDIGQVPNVSNWQKLLSSGEKLTPDQNNTIDPRKNQLFLWGLNFLPFGKTQEILFRLIELKSRFDIELQKKQGKEQDILTEFLPEVEMCNQAIAGELKDFFKAMTKGL